MIKVSQKELELFERIYTGSLLLSYIEDIQHGETKIRKLQASQAVFIITGILSYFNIKKIKVSKGNQLSYNIDWKKVKGSIPRIKFVLERKMEN